MRRLDSILAVLVLALTGTASAAATEPAPLEPIEVSRVSVPGLGSMSHPDWAPDGEHLVFGFTRPDLTGQHLGIVHHDGSGFRCLSCGLTQIFGLDRPLNLLSELSLDKPYAFTDGRRLLTRIIGDREDKGGAGFLSGPTQDFNFAVLECAPSLLDCRDRQLVPVQMPGGGLTRGVQNREARIAPDGRHLAWTEVQVQHGTSMSLGRLVRAADHYELADVRVLNPAFELAPPDPTGFELGGPLYELKNFAPDGRTLTYASFATAQNYDVWELDLATGERRRLTYDMEWNEGTTKSPDATSFVNFSSRTLGRMAPFAQLPRPPFIDFAVYTLTGRWALNNVNRKCLLRPWLFDSGGERGGYFGQPIDTELPDGFHPHGNGPFNADGTRIAFWEFDDAAAGTPEDPDSHLVVANLPARRPGTYTPPETIPFPQWGVPRADWRGYQGRQGVFTVHGRGGGTATIRLLGVVNSQLLEVNYAGYSDDGRSFLSGSERVDAPFTVQYGRWTAALELTGEHTGSLQADLVVQRGGAGSGTVTSELDGVRYEGLPGTDCKEVPTPPLQLEVGPVVDGAVTVAVRYRPAGDDTDRPVRHALVELAGAQARTAADGRATLPAGSGGHVRATAGGFVSASAAVTG